MEFIWHEQKRRWNDTKTTMVRLNERISSANCLATNFISWSIIYSNVLESQFSFFLRFNFAIGSHDTRNSHMSKAQFITSELKTAETERIKNRIDWAKRTKEKELHSSVHCSGEDNRPYTIGQIGGSDNHIKLILLFDFVSVFMFCCVCSARENLFIAMVSICLLCFRKNILFEAFFSLLFSIYKRFPIHFGTLYDAVCDMCEWMNEWNEWCRDSKQYET